VVKDDTKKATLRHFDCTWGWSL